MPEQAGGPKPRDSIMAISPYVGGEHKAEGVSRLIRLASNEGALGTSPKAAEAYAALVHELHRYPDGGANVLRQAIAEVQGLEADRIVCGAGSDELIALLLQAYAGEGDEIIHTQHGFLMYAISARCVGAVPVVAAERNRVADVDNILAAVTPKTRMVFIANPNNPTGTYLSAAEVSRLHDALPGNVLLVLDAAYAEYMLANDYEPGIALARRSNRAIMLRTFSKIYGLGGLRLGWCYAPPAIADVLNRVRGPFNSSAAAQAAGAAAMRDTDCVRKSIAHNAEWRAWLTDELRGHGIRVDDSHANFVLADFGDRDPEPLRLALKSEGILVRQMGGYGLANCLRISIGTADEMRETAAAIARHLPLISPASRKAQATG
jgi:histidinol-phosphate aminotransferase